MSPRAPCRDVHIALGVLAYTGAASPGPQCFIDTRKAGWREFAIARPRPGWWHRVRASLSAHAVASSIGALATLIVVMFAYLALHRFSSPLLSARTASARALHAEPVAAGGGPVPPVATASAPTPVVPGHVLGAAAPRSSGGLVGAVSPPLESVAQPGRSDRHTAGNLHPKPRQATQKAVKARPVQPVQAKATRALESPLAAEGAREHAPALNRSSAGSPRATSFNDVLVAIKDASTIIVANQRGMPTAFRVGDRLPSGAVLISIDPRGESAHTDRGSLNLE